MRESASLESRRVGAIEVGQELEALERVQSAAGKAPRLRCRSILDDQVVAAAAHKGAAAGKNKAEIGVMAVLSGWVSTTTPDGAPTMEAVDESAKLTLKAASKEQGTLATHCTCGNEFMDDSRFCRKCGAARPVLSPDKGDGSGDRES